MKTVSLGLAALAMSASALAPAAASAQRYDGRGYYGDQYRGDRYERPYNGAYREGYNRPPTYYRDSNRYRRCSDGATGTIVGAIAGGLLGNSVAGRGDRFLGTVLGGGAGALAGRAIDRSNGRGC